MRNLEKAKAQLEGCGVSTVIENDTLYVCIEDVQLELAQFEIDYRSNLFDEEQKENYELEQLEKSKELDMSVVSRNWWNNMNEDNQIWLMMKYGYLTPFDPKRVKVAEMIKMYEAEHKS